MKKDLKAVPEGKKGKGLSKLPERVRNKMGYFGAGGAVNAHKEEAMKSPPKSRVRGYSTGGSVYTGRVGGQSLGDLRVNQSLGNEKIVPGYEGPREEGDFKVLNKERREEEKREVFGAAKKLPRKKGPKQSKRIRDALEKRSKK
tara:strand:+ start:50 stop:481 length:432 start_codon:yes stop_codon:yes gene_type:complete